MHIPDEIKREYSEKRQRTENAQKKRREQINAVAPEIGQIESMQLSLAYELSAHAFSITDKRAYDAECSKVRERIAELDAQKITILTSLGYPKDYLDMHYECPICKDTGTIGTAPKKLCSCIKKRIMQYRYASSNLENGEYFSNFNLNIFKNERQRKNMQNLLEFSKQYSEALPHPEPINLVLMGMTGLGKSFTLNCIAHRGIERGIDVIKITAYNLISSILTAMKNGDQLPDFISCDFLVIDDLGTEAMVKNVTVEHIFSIINEREALSKPTAVATNLSPDDIMQRYGERIFSRLISRRYSKVIMLSGDDVRLS